MSLGLLILGLVLFVALVVVHEFGHFIVARRNGVDVEEFGIFFPPRLWKHRTKRGWDFTINAIPLGGFVRLKGEHDEDKQPHGYGRAPLGIKTKILLAGVAMNLVAAFVLLTFLSWVGMPQLVTNQYTVHSDSRILKNEVLVGFVEQGSPAQQIGLKDSDALLSIGQPGHLQPVRTADTLPVITKSLAGQKVTIVYMHNGQQQQATTTLRSQQVVAESQKTSNPKGYLGISPSQYTLQRSTWSSPIVAAGLMAQFTSLTFKGLGTSIMALVHGNTTRAAAQVSGPVGIFELLKNGSLLGYQFVLMIVAVISLSLAIMNALPIPALDGGKLFVTVLARATGQRLTEKTEAFVYGTGFVLLITLVILITIVDVKRSF